MNKKITREQAGQMLIAAVENDNFGDKFYEFAQSLCNDAIQDIESKHTIVDIDGVPYSDDDDDAWYDDFREDFMKAVFEKVKSGEF